jgi:response regulator RpfG family c-di-GMP phosphodiesterase
MDIQKEKSTPAPEPNPPAKTRTLLIVDDEPNIVASLKRLLRLDRYNILMAGNGQEGLDVLAQHDVDVILSDQRMPGMTGVEFLRKAKESRPDVIRIVLSGFTELQSVTDAINEGAIYKFLTKPWDDEQLRAQISEAFHHKELADENLRLHREVQTANAQLAIANKKLEELLAEKRRQLERERASLDIVREALWHVPLPVIGLDDDDTVVFANTAALQLFSERGAVLGSHAADVIPDVLDAARIARDKGGRMLDIDGQSFHVSASTMGHGSLSRGVLITLTSGRSTP